MVSVGGAGRLQKKREAVVWKESADGSEHGRQQGRVELHSQCSEQLGWMA